MESLKSDTTHRVTKQTYHRVYRFQVRFHKSSPLKHYLNMVSFDFDPGEVFRRGRRVLSSILSQFYR